MRRFLPEEPAEHGMFLDTFRVREVFRIDTLATGESVRTLSSEASFLVDRTDTSGEEGYSLKRNVKIWTVKSGGHAGNTVLAAHLSNDCIILHWTGAQRADSGTSVRIQETTPVTRCFEWFQKKKIHISDLDFDPTGENMLVTDVDGGLYVVSLSDFLLPSFHGGSPTSVSVIKQPVSLFSMALRQEEHSPEKKEEKTGPVRMMKDALTSIVVGKCGQPTCCVWWQTAHGIDYAVVGTTDGSLLFINLLTQKEELCVEGFSPGVMKIDLVTSISPFHVFLLVHSIRDQYYRLSLEVVDTDVSAGERSVPVCAKSIVEMFGKDPRFSVEYLARFSNKSSQIFIQRTSPRGPLICALSVANQQLEVFDSDLSKFPVFVHSLGNDSILLHIRDRLMFVVQRDLTPNKMGDRLSIVSSILSGSVDAVSWGSRGVGEHIPVIQEFRFPENEFLCGFVASLPPADIHRVIRGHLMSQDTYRRSLPSTTTSSRQAEERDSPEEESLSSPGRTGRGDSSTEEEGSDGLSPLDSQSNGAPSVFLWSDEALFEITQKHNPAEVFRRMLEHKTSILGIAEGYGKTFDLNLFDLYESVADKKFDEGDFENALRLYDLSNVKPLKIVHRFLKAGMHEIALLLLKRVSTKIALFPIEERRLISDALFLSFLQTVLFSCSSSMRYALRTQFLEAQERCVQYLGGMRKERSHVLEDFRSFLCSNKLYNAGSAVFHLVNCGFVDLAIESAHSRDSGLVDSVINMLVNRKIHRLSPWSSSFLLEHGYGHLLVGKGRAGFFSAFDDDTRAKFMVSSMSCLAAKHAELRTLLPRLRNLTLAHICDQLNPNKLSVQSLRPPTSPSASVSRSGSTSSSALPPRSSELHAPAVKDDKASIPFHSVFEIYVECILCLIRRTRMTKKRQEEKTLRDELHAQLSTHFKSCRPWIIFSLCRQWGDYSSCSMIVGLMGHVVESIRYLLMAAASDASIYEKKESWERQVERLFDEILRSMAAHCRPKTTAGPTRYSRSPSPQNTPFTHLMKAGLTDEEMEKIIRLMIQFVVENDVRHSILEKLLQNNVQKLCPVIVSIFIRYPKITSLSHFSHEFFMEVVACHLNQLELQETRSSTAVENLRQQIFDNLMKRARKRPYVQIPMSVLDAWSKRSTKTSPSHDRLHGVFRGFTCGHCFPEKEFLEKILPDLRDQLDTVRQGMPKFVELVLREYENHRVELACPLCLWKSIRASSFERKMPTS